MGCDMVLEERFRKLCTSSSTLAFLFSLLMNDLALATFSVLQTDFVGEGGVLS